MPLRLVQGRHGSPYWYIRGSVRGIRVDESTGCSDRGKADEIRIRREGQILDRSIHGDAVSKPFAEAALSYMLAGGERQHMDPILAHFGPKKLLIAIGQAEIDGAARALLPNAGPATWNRHVYTPIVAVLHHAARKKWCPKPVVARPKQPAGRVRWITYDEADRLIAAAAPHMRPIVVFLLSTGARLSEAVYLDWRNVNLSRCHVEFIDTKNGESRGVPLHPRAVAALANLPHRTGAVFRRPVRPRKAVKGGAPPKRLGEPYAKREGGGGQLSTAWAGMCKRAGITDFTPHDCRHTWATWHYAANRDIPALMAAGGWKSVEMVMRYAHVNADHLAPGIARIWGNDGDDALQGNVTHLLPKAN